jgi:hypothetical protein
MLISLRIWEVARPEKLAGKCIGKRREHTTGGASNKSGDFHRPVFANAAAGKKGAETPGIARKCKSV